MINKLEEISQRTLQCAEAHVFKHVHFKKVELQVCVFVCSPSFRNQ